jgi:hypothetical protein
MLRDATPRGRSDLPIVRAIFVRGRLECSCQLRSGLPHKSFDATPFILVELELQ